MTAKSQEAVLLLSEARAYVRQVAPYYSHVLYNLVVEWNGDSEDPLWRGGMPTLVVTSNLVCIISPQFFMGIPTVKQRAGCLAHEVHHVLRGMDRYAVLCRIDPELANIAADIPINDSLLDSKDSKGGPLWELPDFACKSELYGFPKGLTMEEYFDLLLQLAKKHGKKRGECNSLIIGPHTFANKVTGGGCGSIVRGTKDTPTAEDKLNEKRGRSGGEIYRIRRQAIKDMQRYANTAGRRGNVPGHLRDLLDWNDSTEEPIIPWETYFATATRRAVGRVKSGGSDYSRRRPSRRSYLRGYLLPGLISNEVHVVVIEDSSGSMGKEQLRTGRVEICGLLERLGLSRVFFIDADANVATAQYVSLRDLKNLPVSGGGGTDFRPAIEFAKKLRPRPQVLVYITDGDGVAPPTAPREFEVIFCIVPSPYQRIPAPWGTTIVMTNDNNVRRAHKWTPTREVEADLDQDDYQDDS